jgi:hypothetical protein
LPALRWRQIVQGEHNPLTRSMMASRWSSKYLAAVFAGPPQGIVALDSYSGLRTLASAVVSPSTLFLRVGQGVDRYNQAECGSGDLDRSAFRLPRHRLDVSADGSARGGGEFGSRRLGVFGVGPSTGLPRFVPVSLTLGPPDPGQRTRPNLGCLSQHTLCVPIDTAQE